MAEDAALEWLARLGDFGVKMFFVISGFLITTLAGRRIPAHRKIAIGRFVVRRAFRIFPAAYVFIWHHRRCGAGLGGAPPGDALHAMTYTMNFAAAPGWWLGHLWSLSIEEQFYLAWPLVLWLSRPRARRLRDDRHAGRRPSRSCRHHHVVSGLEEGIERGLITAVDGFAAGGLLAILRHRLERHDAYMRLIRAPGVMALMPVALMLNLFEHQPVSTTWCCSGWSTWRWRSACIARRSRRTAPSARY